MTILGGNQNEFRCYFDEIYVFGIYGTRHPSNTPTADPTATPSKSPTKYTAAPSKTPTKTPSKHPTTAQPTKAPATRWMIYPNPTLEPTPYPIAEPTVSPVKSHSKPGVSFTTSASGKIHNEYNFIQK